MNKQLLGKIGTFLAGVALLLIASYEVIVGDSETAFQAFTLGFGLLGLTAFLQGLQERLPAWLDLEDLAHRLLDLIRRSTDTPIVVAGGQQAYALAARPIAGIIVVSAPVAGIVALDLSEGIPVGLTLTDPETDEVVLHVGTAGYAFDYRVADGAQVQPGEALITRRFPD